MVRANILGATSQQYTEDLLVAPRDIAALVLGEERLMKSSIANEIFAKDGYHETIPFSVVGALGSYVGYTLDESRAIVRQGFQEYDAIAGRDQITPVQHLFYSRETVESKELVAFMDAQDTHPLHAYSTAFAAVFEYALCSLAERRTEGEHKNLKSAGVRGLRFAKPALNAALKRRPQLLRMYDDPVQKAWLVAEWNGRKLYYDLLGVDSQTPEGVDSQGVDSHNVESPSVLSQIQNL